MPPKGKMHVIVAEDDREVRAILAATLRMRGYEVEEARDGDELRRRLDEMLERSAELPAVISDLRMPGTSPLETLARLHRAGWPVPFIVITALDDEYTHAEAARLGVVALFHKPFDPDEVRAALMALRTCWLQRRAKAS